MLWTRDSKNKLLFLERPDKYDLFLRPEHYILIGSSSQKNADLDDEGRNTLVEVRRWRNEAVEVPVLLHLYIIPFLLLSPSSLSFLYFLFSSLPFHPLTEILPPPLLSSFSPFSLSLFSFLPLLSFLSSSFSPPYGNSPSSSSLLLSLLSLSLFSLHLSISNIFSPPRQGILLKHWCGRARGRGSPVP